MGNSQTKHPDIAADGVSCLVGPVYEFQYALPQLGAFA